MPTVIDIGEKLTTGTGVESYTLNIIAQIIYFLRILAIILAILFILYSAFNYYFSEKKQEEARKTILYSLIGAVISFFVFVIFGFIYDLIVPGFPIDPEISNLAYNVWFDMSSSTQREEAKKYFRALRESCRELRNVVNETNVRSFGWVSISDVRFCGRIVIETEPAQPCWGWGVPFENMNIKYGLNYPCCEGLKEGVINNVKYCVKK
jgi:hypothetical protein